MTFSSFPEHFSNQPPSDSAEAFQKAFRRSSVITPEIVLLLKHVELPVGTPPHGFKKALERFRPGMHQQLRGMGLTTNKIYLLLRETVKRIAETNIGKLKEADICRLRMCFGNPTRKDLLSLSKQMNVSPIDLGFLLAGLEYMTCLIQSISDPELPDRPPNKDGECPIEREIRTRWASATYQSKDDCYISGHRCRCTAIDDGEHRINVFGRVGENDALKRLRSIGVEFMTEQEQQLEGLVCTPDALLKSPLCGWKWIEVKTAVVIPGISPQSSVDRVLRQTMRYVEMYGKGCIIWGRGLFDPEGWDRLFSAQLLTAQSPDHPANEADHPIVSHVVFSANLTDRTNIGTDSVNWTTTKAKTTLTSNPDKTDTGWTEPTDGCEKSSIAQVSVESREIVVDKLKIDHELIGVFGKLHKYSKIITPEISNYLNC